MWFVGRREVLRISLPVHMGAIGNKMDSRVGDGKKIRIVAQGKMGASAWPAAHASARSGEEIRRQEIGEMVTGDSQQSP